MKKTEPGSSAVRKAAMSALRSSAGPAVWTIGTSSSAAMMWASEVLPSPGRPGEQDVVERLAAPPRGLDEDLELGGDLLLVDEVGEAARAKRAVELVLAAGEPDVGESAPRIVADGAGSDPSARSIPGSRRDAHVAPRCVAGAAQRRADQLLGASRPRRRRAAAPASASV